MADKYDEMAFALVVEQLPLRADDQKDYDEAQTIVARAIREAVAEEREACLGIVEGHYLHEREPGVPSEFQVQAVVRQIIERIRARGSNA